MERAEISRSINSVEEANVRPVEEVERLSKQFHATALLEWKRASEPEIHGSEIIAGEGVAWLDANTVVVAKYVAVGVETGKLREAHRGLAGGNQSCLEVAGEDIPLFRRCHCAVAPQPIPPTSQCTPPPAPDVPPASPPHSP